ncbi:MAG TPA: hypothetical protein VF618_16165 [Thermoanaerobaculia bacterium]
MNGNALRHCPDPEVLGAFFEGGLEGQELSEVGRHVERCAECVAILGELAEDEREEGRAPLLEEVPPYDDAVVPEVVPAPEPAPLPAPVPLVPRKKTWAPAFAAAAMLVLAVGGGWWWARRDPFGELKQEMVNSPIRPTVARISGFPYAERPPTFRNANPGEPPPGPQVAVDVVNEALALAAAFEEADQPRGLHASGVALLMTRDRSFVDPAIAKLEAAAQRESDNPRYWNDLAAAYLARGNAPDLHQAEKAVQRALQLDPAMLDAKFNQAVIAENLQLEKEAVALYHAYLAADHDANSPWRAEAQKRIERLLPLL